MSTFVNPATRASVQSTRQQNASQRSPSTGPRSESQTRGLVNELQSLGDSELDQFFSQQSDEELNELASDIDPSRTINGGLSADERRDLFKHLATGLSAEAITRWRGLLSEGLATEFDASVRTFAPTSIDPELVAGTNLQAIDSGYFSLSANGSGLDSQRPLALQQADQLALSSVEPTTQEQWQNYPEWSASDRDYADNAMDALSLIDPSGSTASHSTLVAQQVKTLRAYEQWQQGNLDKDGLLQVLKETNAAFAASPIGMLDSSNFRYRFTSSSLPSALDGRYPRGHENSIGQERGDPGWSVSIGFVSLPDSLISQNVERFLGALDARAEPMRITRVDAERYFDENTVVPDIDLANLSRFRNLPALDASQQRALAEQLVRIDGLLTQAGMPSRISMPASNLIQFDASLIPSTEAAYAGSTRVVRVEDAPLQAIADHLLADALALSQTDEGRQQIQDIHHALNSLAPDNAGKINDEIARTYLLLQSEIQLSSAIPNRADSIPLLLQRLSDQLGAADLSQLAPRLQRNDVPITAESFSFADRVVFARGALAAPTAGAFTLSLENFDQYADNEIAADSEIAALFSLLDTAGQRAPAESTMQSLVGEFVSASTTASSEGDYKRAADKGWQTASYILSGSTTAISEDELKSLFQWVHGDSYQDLGMRTREGYTDRDQNYRYRELGQYGSFGKEKYEFATAWLNSSKTERLAYFGLSDISLARWENAAPIIGQSIGADAQARAIERAEFGFDDAVLLGLSITAGFVIPGSIATLAPAFFGTTVGLGIQAGIGAFSSTLVITKGDVDAALDAGGLALISGGLGEYVNKLDGFTGVIARSILYGAVNELSGQDFIDGVLTSLGAEVGDAVKLRIGNNMPAFVNDFTGKTIELSIRYRGDVDLITAGLENFVKNYAVDNVDTFLTKVVGIENDTLREPLAKAFTEFVNSNGDFDAALGSLENSIVDHVVGSVGHQALERMGGADALHSQVFYGLAAIMLDTGGDLSKLADQADNFALALIGDWAGSQLTQGLDAVLGTEGNPFVAALGEIAGTAIAAGWEGRELSISAFGPLADALGEVLPVGADGASGFLSRGLDALTHSYIANNGDMRAVGQDLSSFVVDEMILAEQSRTTLMLHDRGPRVTDLQQQLQEAGFFHASVDGVYDQDTVAAVNRFQDDALKKLDTERVNAERSGNTARAQQLLDTWAQLSIERSNQVFDEASELLLSTPVSELFQSTVEPQIDETTGELTLGPTLGVGASGTDVIRLQELLQQAGFSAGAIDGDFGPNTASALSAFQQQQIGYLNDILGRTENVDTTQRQQLLDERNTLLNEQQDGVVSSASWLRLSDPLDLEAVAQVTSSQLDAGNVSSVHNEETQALIRSMLEGAPEGWEPDWDGLQVAGSGLWFLRDQIDKDIAHFSERLLSPTVNLDQVLDPRFAHLYEKTVFEQIKGWDPSRLEPLYKDMVEQMDPTHLRMIFDGLDDNYQAGFVQAINNHGSSAVKQAFVDRVHLKLIEDHAKGFSLTPNQKTLLLDSGQIALDIVGIFDPTGIADGFNAGISLVRGDFLGAFLSAVSIIPVIGDLAKLGKLGKMAETVAFVAEEFKGLTRTQMENTSLYNAMKPVFETISTVIDHAQTGAGKVIWDRLDPEHQDTLISMKQKVDDVLNFRTGPPLTRPPRVVSNIEHLSDAGWGSVRMGRERVIRKAQLRIVDNVDNWVIDNNSTVDAYFRQLHTRNGVYNEGAANNAKGNYGEMKTDLLLTETHGYIPVGAHADRLISLDQDWGKNGIDGLYRKPGVDGEYVVIEVKSNNNGTETTKRGQQLSSPWLLNHLEKTFPENQDIIDDILADASRVLVNYESVRAGDLSMQLVNNFGNSTNTRFNP